MPVVVMETELSSGKQLKRRLPASSPSLELALLIPPTLEIYSLSPALLIFTPLSLQISKLMGPKKRSRRSVPGCGQPPLPKTCPEDNGNFSGKFSQKAEKLTHSCV